jgi:hypothetical protein
MHEESFCLALDGGADVAASAATPAQAMAATNANVGRRARRVRGDDEIVSMCVIVD